MTSSAVSRLQTTQPVIKYVIVRTRGGQTEYKRLKTNNCGKYRMIKNLCAPDDYNTESYK
jgi:hypothetical protein